MEKENIVKQDLVSLPDATTENCENQVFQYKKIKGFSYIQYQKIKTTATLTTTHLLIEEVSSLLLFKPKIKTHKISLQNITSVIRKRTWDFWDLAFGVLLFGTGMVQGWMWFFLSALFIYTAFGGVIQITTSDRAVYKIRYSASDLQKDLVDALGCEKNRLEE